jgi:imidazolonepropionase-like amidohydrolase
MPLAIWRDRFLDAHAAADLVALDADPLVDISALERVAVVIARGRIVKWPGQAEAAP